MLDANQTATDPRVVDSAATVVSATVLGLIALQATRLAPMIADRERSAHAAIGRAMIAVATMIVVDMATAHAMNVPTVTAPAMIAAATATVRVMIAVGMATVAGTGIAAAMATAPRTIGAMVTAVAIVIAAAMAIAPGMIVVMATVAVTVIAVVIATDLVMSGPQMNALLRTLLARELP